MMKLLNSFVSPFAARVRVAIYAYDLPVEIVPSGQWLPNYKKSPDFLALNPIGRVPALILDDGSVLPESGVIVEYLAARFMENRLLPPDAQAAARTRLTAHLMETYVQRRGEPLFGLLFAGEHEQRTVDACIAGVDEGLSYVEHFFSNHELAASISIGDCALAPYLFVFADRMVKAFGQQPIIPKHPKVAAYWDSLQRNAAVTKVLDEMRTAIASSPLKALMSSNET
jgi:glutathione S-transferase